MPRPPHICTCGRTVEHGEVCPCKQAAKRARDRRHDAHRPRASERGYGHKWRVARDQFLQVNDRCAWPGCCSPATVVDHRTPHRGDMALFWDRTNWQPLCAQHHNRHKQRQERSK